MNVARSKRLSGERTKSGRPSSKSVALDQDVRRIDVAGRDVTEYLQTLLRKAGYVFHTSAEKEIVRQIKEKLGYIALDPGREEKEWAGGGGPRGGDKKEVDYTLPDGKTIKVG